MKSTRILAAAALTASVLIMVVGIAAILPQAPAADNKPAPPAVGDEAADFELADFDGKKFKLSALAETGPIVVVVLRSLPGTICPFCTTQYGDFAGKAEKFRAAKASVVIVCPGDSQNLKKAASDFARGMKVPKGINLLLDPDYSFTNAYCLRSKNAGDTAYPATFVINGKRKVVFSRVSDTPVQRVSADEVLKVLNEK